MYVLFLTIVCFESINITDLSIAGCDLSATISNENPIYFGRIPSLGKNVLLNSVHVLKTKILKKDIDKKAVLQLQIRRLTPKFTSNIDISSIVKSTPDKSTSEHISTEVELKSAIGKNGAKIRVWFNVSIVHEMSPQQEKQRYTFISFNTNDIKPNKLHKPKGLRQSILSESTQEIPTKPKKPLNMNLGDLGKSLNNGKFNVYKSYTPADYEQVIRLNQTKNHKKRASSQRQSKKDIKTNKDINKAQDERLQDKPFDKNAISDNENVPVHDHKSQTPLQMPEMQKNYAKTPKMKDQIYPKQKSKVEREKKNKVSDEGEQKPTLEFDLPLPNVSDVRPLTQGHEENDLIKDNITEPNAESSIPPKEEKKSESVIKEEIEIKKDKNSDINKFSDNEKATENKDNEEKDVNDSKFNSEEFNKDKSDKKLSNNKEPENPISDVNNDNEILKDKKDNKEFSSDNSENNIQHESDEKFDKKSETSKDKGNSLLPNITEVAKSLLSSSSSDFSLPPLPPKEEDPKDVAEPDSKKDDSLLAILDIGPEAGKQDAAPKPALLSGVLKNDNTSQKVTAPENQTAKEDLANENKKEESKIEERTETKIITSTSDLLGESGSGKAVDAKADKEKDSSDLSISSSSTESVIVDLDLSAEKKAEEEKKNKEEAKDIKEEEADKKEEVEKKVEEENVKILSSESLSVIEDKGSIDGISAIQKETRKSDESESSGEFF